MYGWDHMDLYLQSYNHAIVHMAPLTYGHTPIVILSPWGKCVRIMQQIAQPTMPIHHSLVARYQVAYI